MPKHYSFFLALLFASEISVAQIDSSEFKEHSLYLFKTEEDFFNNKKVYRGQCLRSDDKKIIRYITSNSKKRTLNLEDSCNYYFGYQIGDEIQIRPDKKPGSFMYYSFGGGNRDCYCVVYGYLPNYDRKGYLLGLTSPAGLTYMYFNDRLNNLNMVQLDEFLRSKPKLQEQYRAEKARADKQDWERNKLATGIKYLKLFINEQNKSRPQGS